MFVWDDHCGFEVLPDEPLRPLLQPWLDAKVSYLSINAYYDPVPWTRAVENIAALRRRLPIEVPEIQIVSSVSEIDDAYANRKMAVTFDIEGMNALNGRLDLVQFYYDLGVRHMLFAYNRNNLAGSGCHDEDVGLTNFGRQVVDEMSRVGMVIDCSHSGFRTTMEAMERSSDPVIFSHSNPKALADHERNITDEQIRACAETGGVIGINGVNLFLGEKEASPVGVARHAAYIADLTGQENVGISLDYSQDLEGEPNALENTSVLDLFYSNPEYWPADAGYDGSIMCLHVKYLVNVADELRKVGFDQDGVADVMGKNFRRVAERVWK